MIRPYNMLGTLTEWTHFSILINVKQVFFSSSSLNKVLKKEVTNKSTTIRLLNSNDIVPNYIDDDSSIHKTLVCENGTNQKENNSTVIMINRPTRTENSSIGKRLGLMYTVSAQLSRLGTYINYKSGLEQFVARVWTTWLMKY